MTGSPVTKYGAAVTPLDSVDYDSDELYSPRGEGDAPRSSRISRWGYLMYRIDSWIALRKNQMKALVLIALVLVFGGGFLIALGPLVNGKPGDALARLTGGKRYSVFWMAWSFVVNPGNHIGYNGAWERFVGVSLTVMGVLYMSTVLGLVVDVIRAKMDELKLGSTVLEEGHTVILNYTDRAPLVIQELILANESEGGGVIVILSEFPSKEEIESDIEHRFKGCMLGTRVLVRNGTPMLMQNLNKVSVQRAKVTIVLAETGGPVAKSDALSLRQVLTINAIKNLQGFALVEIRDVDNEPLVKLIGGASVETIVSHDTVGRMMVMASRNPGLSRVYSEVLGFAGDEFYMKAFSAVDGVPFGELQQIFPDAIPIGVASCDEKRIWLKPSLGRLMKPGEKVIVIAQDDDTFEPRQRVAVTTGELPPQRESKRKPELILFCGWRRDIRDVLAHVDRIVAPGSSVHMCSDSIPIHERNGKLLAEGLNTRDLENVHLEHFNICTSVRRKLEDLPLEEYTSVMVFPDQAQEEDMMHSDSHAIATLLLIRDIQKRRHDQKVAYSSPQVSGGVARRISRGLSQWRNATRGCAACPIICEILDPRTQATIESNTSVAASSDFCQSNRLIAQVLAMVSENRGVKHLLDELLSSEGSSFLVATSGEFVHKNERLTFYDLAARINFHTHSILVGYQTTDESLKTTINPPDKHVLKPWDDLDLIVLRGDSSLTGQDRTMAHLASEAFGTFAAETKARLARDASDGDGDLDASRRRLSMGPLSVQDRIKKAQSYSATMGIHATLGDKLQRMKLSDLEWLEKRVQDEIRARDLQKVQPLALPLDPTLQNLIDGIGVGRASFELDKAAAQKKVQVERRNTIGSQRSQSVLTENQPDRRNTIATPMPQGILEAADAQNSVRRF